MQDVGELTSQSLFLLQLLSRGGSRAAEDVQKTLQTGLCVEETQRDRRRHRGTRGDTEGETQRGRHRGTEGDTEVQEEKQMRIHRGTGADIDGETPSC